MYQNFQNLYTPPPPPVAYCHPYTHHSLANSLQHTHSSDLHLHSLPYLKRDSFLLSLTFFLSPNLAILLLNKDLISLDNCSSETILTQTQNSEIHQNHTRTYLPAENKNIRQFIRLNYQKPFLLTQIKYFRKATLDLISRR